MIAASGTWFALIRNITFIFIELLFLGADQELVEVDQAVAIGVVFLEDVFPHSLHFLVAFVHVVDWRVGSVHLVELLHEESLHLVSVPHTVTVHVLMIKHMIRCGARHALLVYWFKLF